LPEAKSNESKDVSKDNGSKTSQQTGSSGLASAAASLAQSTAGIVQHASSAGHANALAKPNISVQSMSSAFLYASAMQTALMHRAVASAVAVSVNAFATAVPIYA